MSPIMSVLLRVILALGTLVTGLAAASAAQDAPQERVLRIEKNGYPETLDPQVVWDMSQDMVIGLGFEGLTRIDEQLSTVPAAAESWAFSADGLTLTFYLRAGLTYSDGSPLTAERFRDAIVRTCDPLIDSMNASFLFIIAGCEDFFTSLEETSDGAAPEATPPAVYAAAMTNVGVRALDERTLQIQLTRPAFRFPSLASMSMFFPAKEELIADGGEEWWRDPANLVGNGPFQIADLGNDTDVPSRMVFAANERYWAGRPTLDRIEYVLANQPRTGEERIAAYRAGEVDMLWLGYENLPAIEVDPELAADFRQAPRAATIHLALNPHLAPFDDRKVREAFAYGFDRESSSTARASADCSPEPATCGSGTGGSTASAGSRANRWRSGCTGST